VTKRNAPREPRRPRYALRVRKVRRDSLDGLLPIRELARILRATLWAYPACPRRGWRGPSVTSQIKSLIMKGSFASVFEML